MKESATNKIVFYGIGFLALLFQLGILYYIYWHRHYLVPPGNDVITHYQIIENILKRGQFSQAYPPGFHLLVIGLSKVFRVSIWTILTNWTPALMILPTFCLFFLLRQLFSLRVSIISSAILLLTSGYPLYGFIDGNYPDMLAYGVFTVLLLAFLIRYLKDQKIMNLVWVLIFLLLTAFTHHFTFFNILGILSIFVLYRTYLALCGARLKLVKKIFLGAGILCFFLAVAYLLAEALYGGYALGFITGIFTGAAKAVTAFNELLKYSDYRDLTGNLVLFFGLAGFLYLLMTKFSDKGQSAAKPLIIIWVLFFYILSRQGEFGFPGRFARELGLPLTVSMAYLFDFLIEKNPYRNRFGLILAGGVIGYLIFINSALFTGLAVIPDGFSSNIWYWPVDQAKVEYLASNVSPDSTVLYNPAANLFFPVKSANKLQPVSLTDHEMQIIDRYLEFPDNLQAKNNYLAVVLELKKQFVDADYIFDDVQPPGASQIYPAYRGYLENKKILASLELRGRVLKKFDDGAVLYSLK